MAGQVVAPPMDSHPIPDFRHHDPAIAIVSMARLCASGCGQNACWGWLIHPLRCADTGTNGEKLMSARTALVKFVALAASGTLLGGGAVHVAETMNTARPHYVKHAKIAKTVAVAAPIHARAHLAAVPRKVKRTRRVITRTYEPQPEPQLAMAAIPLLPPLPPQPSSSGGGTSVVIGGGLSAGGWGGGGLGGTFLGGGTGGSVVISSTSSGNTTNNINNNNVANNNINNVTNNNSNNNNN